MVVVEVLELEVLELELLGLVELVEAVVVEVEELELELLGVELLGLVVVDEEEGVVKLERVGPVEVEAEVLVVELPVEVVAELEELVAHPAGLQGASTITTPTTETPTTVTIANVTANFQCDFVLVVSVFLIALVHATRDDRHSLSVRHNRAGRRTDPHVGGRTDF